MQPSGIDQLVLSVFQTFLRDLVDEVLQTLKRNLKVDWTEPSREEIRARGRLR
jgi:hypothetical protein